MFLVSAGVPGIITGTVVDTNGYALQGVTVTEQGTSNAVQTDMHGKYSITVSSRKAVLVFACPGMLTQTIPVGNAGVINIQMSPAPPALPEAEEQGQADAVSGLPENVAGVRVKPFPASMAKKSMAYTAGGSFPGYRHPSGDWNTESYSTIRENGFKDVLHNPLSTFSIDVDRASYANVRRFINMGQLPPVDAVRIEEMINYFSYDYPQPDSEHPFTVSTELSACPWNSSHQLLKIGLQGQSIDKENLPPSNIVFLLDVSGSMGAPNKLPLLKSAFSMLVRELRPEDRVAIAVYAGAAGEVLESTPGSEKEKIMAALDILQAGGSTAGGEGLKLAYSIAEKHFIEGGNNRIILATDGDFNIGPSSDAEMERFIEKKREKGIFITVLGFGMGNYKDSKMETIADKGNGNYAYIDNIQEASKMFVSEFGGTMFTIAKDVKFQIEFNPARVKGYRLVGYENRLLNDEDFNDDTKDAGEMGAGHTVTALYELVPAGSDEEVADIDPLKYQSARQSPQERAGNRHPDHDVTGYRADRKSGRYTDELMTVKVRYKDPDGDKSTLYELPVKGRLREPGKTSDDFRFAAAVAQWGMILRNSEFLEEGTTEGVLEAARNARGKDTEGYRGEFIRIVTTSSNLIAARSED